MTEALEIQVRKPCSQPEPQVYFGGLPGVRCPECGAYTYRADNAMEHKLVVVWMPLTEALHCVGEGIA